MTSTGVPRRTASSHARLDERTIGAAAARLRQRRAAEERGRARRVRPRGAGHGLSVDVGEVLEVVGIRPGRRHLRRRGSVAERDRGDLGGGEPLVVAHGKTHLDIRGRTARRRLRQDHADGERRRLVVDEPERDETLDEVARRRTGTDLPRARRAAPSPQRVVDLRANLGDLFHAQAKALRDVPAGAFAAAQIEHVSLVHDPLLARAERGVGVRVLRELLRRDHPRPSCFPHALR